MKLTVIVPTYNRKNILKKCLDALFTQSYSQSDYEIIVIDDGSTDGTGELVNSLINGSPCPLRYFKQENRGPAAARNVGIKNVNGEVILFLGDDIIATSTLLVEHAKWHGQFPDDNVAVLGYVTWSSEIEITPFMRWLDNGGPQFHFWQIKDKVEVDTQKYFYTSNTSVKRKFFLENSEFFDEEFPYAAYEDIELGYRLKKRGMILKYNKEAVGYHYHYSSLVDVCQRMIKAGESSQILAKKIGREQKYYSKSVFREILSKFKFITYYLLAKFYEKKAIKENIFKYVTEYYYLIGVEKYCIKENDPKGSNNHR